MFVKIKRMLGLSVLLAIALLAAGCFGKIPERGDGYTLTGVVVDGKGSGVEEVELVVAGERVQSRVVKTDESGSWTVTGLRGPVKVTPSKDGYTFKPEFLEFTNTSEDIGFLALTEDESDDEEGTYTIGGTVKVASGEHKEMIPLVVETEEGEVLAVLLGIKDGDSWTLEVEEAKGVVRVYVMYELFDLCRVTPSSGEYWIDPEDDTLDKMGLDFTLDCEKEL